MIVIHPEISVVIPVKNEASKIRDCIDGILNQTVPVKEIIVIDSGSTDGTIEILQTYPIVNLIRISSSEFNHGETRNMGVKKAKGEFVILTVGDARPMDNSWISNLLIGFDNLNVAGVCGMQVVPHDPNKNPVEWFRPVDPVTTIKKYSYTPAQFQKLTPQEKKQACSWDDVTAMYRRSALEKTPFQKTSYCEDAIWAKEALMAGFSIVYNPAARVYHYHIEDKDFTLKRTLTSLYFRYKHFNYVSAIPKKGLMDQLRTIKTIWQSNPLNPQEKLNWVKYNKNQFDAMLEAHKIFTQALSKGEEELDKEHERLCGKPPIPLKSNN